MPYGKILGPSASTNGPYYSMRKHICLKENLPRSHPDRDLDAGFWVQQVHSSDCRLHSCCVRNRYQLGSGVTGTASGTPMVSNLWGRLWFVDIYCMSRYYSVDDGPVSRTAHSYTVTQSLHAIGEAVLRMYLSAVHPHTPHGVAGRSSRPRPEQDPEPSPTCEIMRRVSRQIIGFKCCPI